jgi:hypothetical protein
MPRYFFNIEGLPGPNDDEGTFLPGLEQARAAAVIHAGEMLKDFDGQFWGGLEWRMHVTDEQGATVCTLSIRGTMGGHSELAGAAGSSPPALRFPSRGPVASLRLRWPPV